MSLHAQTYFTPVDTTGLPYILVITNITINGEGVPEKTEVGAFDDTLCAGAAVFNGVYNFQITTWGGNPSLGLAGFANGNIMKFKIWVQTDSVWQELEMTPIYEVGNGSFGFGGYSVLALDLTRVKVGESANIPESYDLAAYPNPFNHRVNFVINTTRTGAYQMLIHSLAGEEIYHKNGFFKAPGKYFLAWDGISTKGRHVPSGIYLVSIINSRINNRTKIIYQK
ncbi:MAG: T9SS type A sorting domain-containing protein [Candidatus Marinimicrobia bacterium]|nr:T9SS type A sorting domain-containing protein [Candidatus Neomarinimicrobiota bacterium]